MIKQAFAFSWLLLIFLSGSFTAIAAPDAKLIPFWDVSDESNLEKIDHSLWQSVLDHHLNITDSSAIHLVDYNNLQKHQQELNDYLALLNSIDPRQYSRSEQKAFWLNLYNATTVKIIVDHYPVQSIKKIKSSLFSFGPWNKKWLKIANQPLSLNDIEHGILRPIWQDNRIHYGVNCASLGCPNLSHKAFTSNNTEALLNQLAIDFINHERGVKITGNMISFSSIYAWYKVDFGDTNQGLIEHWKQYANPNLSKQLATLSTKKEITFDDQYDWALNKSN